MGNLLDHIMNQIPFLKKLDDILTNKTTIFFIQSDHKYFIIHQKKEVQIVLFVPISTGQCDCHTQCDICTNLICEWNFDVLIWSEWQCQFQMTSDVKVFWIYANVLVIIAFTILSKHFLFYTLQETRYASFHSHPYDVINRISLWMAWTTKAYEKFK